MAEEEAPKQCFKAVEGGVGARDLGEMGVRWGKLSGRGNSSNIGAQSLLWILGYVHEMIILVLIIKL